MGVELAPSATRCRGEGPQMTVAHEWGSGRIGSVSAPAAAMGTASGISASAKRNPITQRAPGRRVSVPPQCGQSAK